MRKYLLVPLVFLLLLGLSAFFLAVEADHGPGGPHVHRTEENLSRLSTAWLYLAGALSATLLAVLGVADFFRLVEGLGRRRRVRGLRREREARRLLWRDAGVREAGGPPGASQ